MNCLKNRYLYILLFSIFFIHFAYSQSNSNVEQCGYKSNLQKIENNNPGILQQIQQQKNEILQNLQNSDNQANATAKRVLYTIPVVVHVVWNDPSEDISDAQILSQIEVLNEDFRALNADIADVNALFVPDIADVEFEFCLANVDPQGNATTGITRTQTMTTSFSAGFGADVMDPADGGVANWDASQYLNIYVCNLSYGLLGYGTPPGGPPNFDGVVVTYRAFGKGFPNLIPNFNLGRTATHEVGHYFNLDHPWGVYGGGCTDDDGIADTPTTIDQNIGCPTIGAASTTCGSQDNFYLFMDYCDDECLLMFSQGQKAVMVSTLTTQRSGLLSSIATCDSSIIIDPTLPNVNVALTSNENNIICNNQLAPTVTVTNIGNTDVITFEFVYNFNGSTNFTQFWTGNLQPNTSVDIELFDIAVSSDINLNIEVVNTNNNEEIDLTDNAIELNYSISVAGTFPLIETFEEEEFEQGSWLVENDFGLTTTGWTKNNNVGAQGSNGSFVIENEQIAVGTVNYLTTPFLDIFGKTNISLKFDYAYAKKVDENADNLSIIYSTDCGVTWNDLYVFDEIELATANETSATFVPILSDWKEKIINLDFLNNQNKVTFRFKSISFGGNPIYIDNININFLNEIPANVNDITGNSIYQIYPNPIKNGLLNITYNNLNNKAKYQILNTSGKIVKTGNLNQFNIINVENLHEHFLLVKIITDDKIFVQKVLLYN